MNSQLERLIFLSIKGSLMLLEKHMDTFPTELVCKKAA